MAMLAVLKRMNRGDLTNHGFRSSFSDWAAGANELPREVAEMALAHTRARRTRRVFALMGRSEVGPHPRRLCSTSVTTLSRVKDVLPPLAAWCRGRRRDSRICSPDNIHRADAGCSGRSAPHSARSRSRCRCSLCAHRVPCWDGFGLGLGDVTATRAPRSSIAP
jgi:hypothetical protein